MSSTKNEPLSTEDLRLFQLARAGDTVALDELMRSTCQRILRHVCSRFSGWELDELHNMVFLELSKREKLTQVACAPIRAAKNPQAFPSYAMQTAIRICLDRFRKERPALFSGIDIVMGLEDKKEMSAETRVRLSEVARAIGELKDVRQRAILYATLQGIDMEEIAASLNITRGHGDVLKKRALDALRKQFSARKERANG